MAVKHFGSGWGPTGKVGPYRSSQSVLSHCQNAPTEATYFLIECTTFGPGLTKSSALSGEQPGVIWDVASDTQTTTKNNK